MGIKGWEFYSQHKANKQSSASKNAHHVKHIETHFKRKCLYLPISNKSPQSVVYFLLMRSCLSFQLRPVPCAANFTVPVP